MKNYFHITAGDSAGLSLKRSFELRNILPNEVISLKDDLRVGPLTGIDSETGYDKRSKWWDTITEMCEDKDNVDSFYGDIKKMERIKKLLEENKEICIWHGASLFDKLMMARLIHFINPSPENIFVVPVSAHTVTNIRGKQFVPDSLGVMNPEQIEELDPYVRPITKPEINEAIAMWKHVESNKATMRILNDTIIEMQEDNYFDSTLLANCTNEFQKSSRVVAETLVETGFYVSDTILSFRLKELVRQNRLEAKGTLRNMRDYEVKIPRT
jgi:hypothetical protein